MGVQLDSLLENLYTQADFWASNKQVLLESISPVFSVDEVASKKVMRNIDTRFTHTLAHAPYRVTHSLMRDIFRRIILVPSLDKNFKKEIKNDTCISQIGRESIVIFPPDDVPTLLDDNGDYTPDFMLALRIRNHFNNQKFKTKVEDELSRFSKKVEFASTEYFVPYDNDCVFDGSFSDLSGLAKKIVLENVSFFWRD